MGLITNRVFLLCAPRTSNSSTTVPPRLLWLSSFLRETLTRLSKLRWSETVDDSGEVYRPSLLVMSIIFILGQSGGGGQLRPTWRWPVGLPRSSQWARLLPVSSVDGKTLAL